MVVAPHGRRGREDERATGRVATGRASEGTGGGGGADPARSGPAGSSSGGEASGGGRAAEDVGGGTARTIRAIRVGETEREEECSLLGRTYGGGGSEVGAIGAREGGVGATTAEVRGYGLNSLIYLEG
jgi:hypothetical protein